MKTLEILYKNIFLTKILALLFIISMSCSKGDGSAAVEVVKNTEKELSSFSFLSANNGALATDVIANINTTAKTITANLPSDTPLTALIPTIAISAKASINPQGEHDFTNPVTYTVTAEDGSTKSYSVSASSKTSAKQIASFVFLATNNAITSNVVATINEEDKTITATMPLGTNVTELQPEVQLSELATVDLNTVQDFTEPIEYTVTAEDGSEEIYTVTITTILNQRQILQAVLDANPGTTLDWDLQNTIDLNILDGVTTNTEGTIVELIMAVDNLSVLPPEIGQLTMLEKLNIFNNKITEVPNEIGELKNLVFLSLSSNLIQVLPSEIGELTNLKILILTDNQIGSLPAEIGNLNQLTNLVARSNSLTMLPAEIRGLTSLKILSLANNQFESIIPEVGDLNNLTSLNLNGNSLSVLPKEIGELPNLTLLNIAENQFQEFPIEITTLENLTFLSISANNITTIDVAISNLSNLESLFISDNELNSVPREIGKLINLKKLSLRNNKITSLPPEIGFLIKLNELSIRNNNLTSIPRSICYLEDFNDLNLSKDNQVNCAIPTQKDVLISIYSANPGNTLEWSVDNYQGVSFNANGKPIAITANNKNLSRIPDTIDQLVELGNLAVNSNNLTSLPTTLGNLNSLTVVTAASNNLNTVPSELGQLTNLVLLSLTSNPITSIPTEVCDLQTSNGGVLTLLTDPGEGCD
ncbi:leucine-rich repeat domain-containing protein [Maribacter sp. ACAM166]|uniref:leucine-rich repeat domain-containing protein n=1 Tax=Maribacter sp. ACAM166 TaxID=2508996 RepID=UPI0014859DF7|nr:leucine-rich repeat domain-containing protein [Maribacter sp. ACAM166]